MTQQFPPPPPDPVPFLARFIITIDGSFIPAEDRVAQDNQLISTMVNDMRRMLQHSEDFGIRQIARVGEMEVSQHFFQDQYGLYEALPKHLWGTATHIADPGLFLVGVRSLTNPAVVSPMVFRGIIPGGAMAGVSTPIAMGHASRVQLVAVELLLKIDPRDDAARTIFPGNEEDYQTVCIEIRGGVLTDVAGLPEGWHYRLIDHDDLAAEGGADNEEEEHDDP